MFQQLVGYAKDDSPNRVYNTKKWRIIAKTLCYLRIHDEKNRHFRDGSPQYLIVDCLGRAIKKD